MSKHTSFHITAVLVATAYVFAPIDATATVVTPGTAVMVSQSHAYASFGGGDFVFSTSMAVSGCASGWYIKATDPGYKTAVAVVLTAQAAGLQVIVYGDNSDLWPGSPSGQYCRLQSVGLNS